MGQMVVPIETIADLLAQLGGIAPARVRFRPLPGTATEKDVLDVQACEDRLCELVDGVLVEKAMGFRESFLASVLSAMLWGFVEQRGLGLVTGEAGMVRLAPGLLRMPTVLHEEDVLEGGTVLPGLTLPLREPFARLDPQGHD